MIGFYQINPDAIKSFTGEHAFLSNFYESPFIADMLYPTVEHFFQAAKTVDPALRRRISAAPTPGLAKGLGRRVQLRDDWEQIKDDIMYRAVRLKFSAHPSLALMLLATGNRQLVEREQLG